MMERRFWTGVCGLGLLVLAGMAAPVAASVCADAVKGYDPIDYETITVSGTAIGFTAAKVQQAGGINAALAFVTVENNPISMLTVTTPAPTATVGHQLAPGQSMSICGLTAIKAFRAIRTGADAILKVTYFKAR